MNTRLLFILLGIIITVSIHVGGIFILQSPLKSIQCDVGFLPKAHASLAYSSISDVYHSADVVLVG